MYKIKILADCGEVLEILEFVYISEAEDTAEAFENLTEYSVERCWEED